MMSPSVSLGEVTEGEEVEAVVVEVLMVLMAVCACELHHPKTKNSNTIHPKRRVILNADFCMYKPLLCMKRQK